MSEYIVEVIGQMPDAIYERALEEIVRCKDCVKWSFFDVEDGVRFGECAEFTAKVDKGCGHATREYGFCAWGEHK